MVKKVINYWDKSKEVLLGIAITAMLGLLFKMYVFITVTYPRDKEEQQIVNRNFKYDMNAVRGLVELKDSEYAEKNKVTNARVDKISDSTKPLNIKVDILLEMNKQALQKYELMEKYLKYQSENK